MCRETLCRRILTYRSPDGFIDCVQDRSAWRQIDRSPSAHVQSCAAKQPGLTQTTCAAKDFITHKEVCCAEKIDCTDCLFMVTGIRWISVVCADWFRVRRCR